MAKAGTKFPTNPTQLTSVRQARELGRWARAQELMSGQANSLPLHCTQPYTICKKMGLVCSFKVEPNPRPDNRSLKRPVVWPSICCFIVARGESSASPHRIHSTTVSPNAATVIIPEERTGTTLDSPWHIKAKPRRISSHVCLRKRGQAKPF
jgi:hypothetical protein